MKRKSNEEETVKVSSHSYASRVSAVYNVLGAHPYIAAFLTIVILTPLCYGAQNNMTPSAKMIFCLIGIALPAAVILLLVRSGLAAHLPSYAVAGVTVIAGLVLSYCFVRSFYPALWIFCYTLLAAVLFRLSLLRDNSDRDRHNAFAIMAVSFALKFSYVLYTSCYTRQNDVGRFNTERGHASYIEYLIENRHLPDFYPASRWQYYHPPLHHTVSAGWISICENVFGAGYNYARESLQMLMLFYSAACVIAVYKLLRHFGFSGKALCLPLMLFAFHPAFILSSGAINNDQLATLLIILTMLFTVRWSREATMKNIIPIAISIGFAMMTKLNAALIAPAVAVIFLWKLAKNIKTWKKLFVQFAVFGVIVFPLGLWWSVRNYIRWGMDPTYVPNLGEETQYVGDDIIGRLFSFAPKQFKRVFENWLMDGHAYDEYNPNVAILKNSLFAEHMSEDNFPKGTVFVPTLLFWVAMLLALFSVGIMVYHLIKKDTRLELHDKAFFAGYWAFLMYYFYLFCYLFPNTCTQNFRYIVPLLAVSAVQFAMLFDSKEEGGETKLRKAVNVTVTCAIFLFALLSTATYLLVGYVDSH